MIKKALGIILLSVILGILLLGNLTQSRTYQKNNNEEVELFRLDLNGIDFLTEVSSDEFKIIEDSDYSYDGFKYMILALSGCIVIMIVIQLFGNSTILEPLAYSVLLVPAFFIGVYLAQYPNFYVELSLAKFSKMNQTIDSKMPALNTIQWLAIIGLVFNWGAYIANKRMLAKTS